MEQFRNLLVESEPLLLFLVIGLGYMAGQIKVRGFGVGIAGVLFAGLLFGAWIPEGAQPLTISHRVTEVGLILFVYAVGLTSGPGFFSAIRKKGLRFNISIVLALLAGAVVALVAGRLLGLSPGLISGVYCGGLTNTPALAATSELLRTLDPAASAEPTLAYSISYPFGVFGALISFQILTLLCRKRFEDECREAREAAAGAGQLVARNFEVRNPELFGKAIGELRIQEATGLIVSRLRHGGDVFVPTKYTQLNEGDVLVAVGRKENIEKGAGFFGAESNESLEQYRGSIEMRRILMSNRKLVGVRIEDLGLDRQFNCQITRLRRADFDICPSPDLVLELGDRLRVVAPRERLGEVSRFFGDSERSISELDFTAITLGISLGVLLGMVPLPVPGGTRLALGFAGGPLVVALILGKLGRTGPIVWSIPLESNLALRHVGLLFFLAGVGVSAGSRFLEALAASGWQLLALGALTTAATGAVAMVLLDRFGHASVISTLGATSGMQTQPASLARAYELSKSDETYVAYATTYPVAMIGKILLAQLLVVFGGMLG
ncbi:transporter [Candidatus Poribacteria bacterium]|nr:transporter [Candidatus Poribacteria bacterium]